MPNEYRWPWHVFICFPALAREGFELRTSSNLLPCHCGPHAHERVGGQSWHIVFGRAWNVAVAKVAVLQALTHRSLGSLRSSQLTQSLQNSADS